MYAYDIKYYHTRYGWIMSRAVHIYVYRGNRVLRRKSRQKRSQRIGKSPYYHEICTTCYDMCEEFVFSAWGFIHRNSSQKLTQRIEKPPGTMKLILGMSGSSFTEIVLIKVRSRSKNLPQVHSNLLYMPWSARKSSPRLEGLEVHRKSSQKYAQRLGKPLTYHEICATCCDLRRSHLLGMRVQSYTEIVLKNVFNYSAYNG